MANPVGRPSTYSQEIAATICGRMSEGESVRNICKSDDMPASSTIYLWLIEHKEFSENYARAIKERACYLAEEAIEIADDGTNDWMERRSESEKGAGVNTGWVLNGEHVQRSRLRVDTRKWLVSKLDPRAYGDKIETTLQGGDKPVAVEQIIRTIIDPKT